MRFHGLWGWLSLAVRCFAGILFVVSANGAKAPSAHYPLLASTVEHPRGLIVLIPGASGLEIMGDRSHYPGVATAFRTLGYDTLLLDYKGAYAASSNAPTGSTGDKIAWVVQGAIDWTRAQSPRYSTLPVTFFAWSLGGEGALRILTDSHRAEAAGVERGVLYYPSCKELPQATVIRPTLALMGELDTVTPAAELKDRLVTESGSLLRLEVLSQAYHGFDVASLSRRRRIREHLLFGTTHTFAYHAAAAARSGTLWQEFLAEGSKPASRSSP